MPLNFNYLITILIRKGSLEIYELLDDIFWPFGTVTNRDIVPSSLDHMIMVILATRERSFVNYIKVNLDHGWSIYVDFEYTIAHLRCSIYFSLDHSSHHCEEPPHRFCPQASRVAEIVGLTSQVEPLGLVEPLRREREPRTPTIPTDILTSQAHQERGIRAPTQARPSNQR